MTAQTTPVVPDQPAVTDADVARYWEDGFLTGVPVWSEAEARDFRERLERLEAAQRAALGGVWEVRHDYPWARDHHPMRALFHEMATHPRLVEAATRILGPNVLIRNADVFIKEPGNRRTVDWHLDTAEHDGTEDAYVTAWIGLGEEGAHAHNGGMRFVRGGHRLELADRPTDRHHLTLSEQARSVVTPDRVVQSVMAPGEASFHHALMPHESGGNLTNARRIGFVVRFMGTGISAAMAESGVATLVAGVDTHHTFALKEHFPVTWTPQVP